MRINEKEFILDELKEHTSDCDAARCQHFYMESKYRKYSLVFETVKSIVFLATISLYVIFVSGIKQSAYLSGASLFLSVLSTIMEIASYMLMFKDKATEHWKAAQMYSELYRKCQFFCSDHANESLEVWREKLRDISEELSRLALMSPDVSSESYQQACGHLAQKKYPVHKALMHQRMAPLDEVVRKIRAAFNDSKIEIYVFGSYLTSLCNNDIDIAVIWHCEEPNPDAFQKMVVLESEYAIHGLNLDITVITEPEIVANRCTQFIKNISKGECYYKSLDVQKCLKEYDIAMSDYSGMIDYFIDTLDKCFQNSKEKVIDKERVIVGNLFYLYYHMLSFVLSKFNINWYGERSILNEADILAATKEVEKYIGISSEQFRTIILHARAVLDKKNRLLNTDVENADIDQLKRYFNDDKGMIQKCREHLKNGNS